MEISAGLLSRAMPEGDWTRQTVWTQTNLTEWRGKDDGTETWCIVWTGPKVLFWHLTGGTEGNHRNMSGQLVSLPRCEPDNSKYNSEAMLMLPACSVCCSISTMIIYQVIYIIKQVIGENKNCSAPMGTTACKVKEKERACMSHLTAWSPTTTIISTAAAVHDILTCTVNFGNVSRLAVKSKHLYMYSYIPLCYIIWTNMVALIRKKIR